VASNIDFKNPEQGEVIYKLCMIAKERNIDYTPTQDSQAQLLGYCTRKGLQPPIELKSAPQYVPTAVAYDANVDKPPSEFVGHNSQPVYMPPQP
jgi:hypothetical protein